MTDEAPAPAPAPIPYRFELWRKAIHLSSAAFPIAYAWWLSRPEMLVILGAACLTALAIEIGRRHVAFAASLFERSVGGMLRSHERGAAVGATWMLLAYLAVVFVAPREIAITAMSAVSLGDAVAALVGRAIGRVKLGNTGKSLEGALACLLVTWAAARWLALLSPGAATVAAVAATLAELPRGPGDDNARVALVTAVAAYLGTLWFGLAASAVS